LMGEQHKERCQWTMGFAWGNPFLFVALTNRARARLVSKDEFEDEDDWVARSWSNNHPKSSLVEPRGTVQLRF
jgi:hypothetical protein